MRSAYSGRLKALFPPPPPGLLNPGGRAEPHLWKLAADPPLHPHLVAGPPRGLPRATWRFTTGKGPEVRSRPSIRAPRFMA